MDGTSGLDAERAARRREQNRVAQRNHRKRKQFAQASRSTGEQIKEPSLQPSEQQLIQGGRADGGSNLNPMPFTFDEQLSEDNIAADISLDCSGGLGHDHVETLQPDFLDCFDNLVRTEPSPPGWDPQPLYPSVFANNETVREPLRSQDKSLDLYPVKVPAALRSDNDTNLGRLTRGDLTQTPHSSPALSTSTRSTAYTAITEPSSRGSPLIDPSPKSRSALGQSRTATSRGPKFTLPASGRRTSQEDRRIINSPVSTATSRQQQYRRQSYRDDAPAKISSRKATGQTCLQLAAAEGSGALVRYFLELGMRPDARDAQGMTALHHAVRGGHEDAVNALLRAGAYMEATDDRGRTALHLAIEQRQEDMAILLIRKGADVQATVGPERR